MIFEDRSKLPTTTHFLEEEVASGWFLYDSSVIYDVSDLYKSTFVQVSFQALELEGKTVRIPNFSKVKLDAKTVAGLKSIQMTNCDQDTQKMLGALGEIIEAVLESEDSRLE